MSGNEKDGYVKLEVIIKAGVTLYFVQAKDVPRQKVDCVQWSVILSDIESGMSLRESLLRLFE